MTEGPPPQTEKIVDPESERVVTVRAIIEMAKPLHESQEKFSFPGIDTDEYIKIKQTEEQYPGFTTPIDTLLERFRSEGIKIVLGQHPESGNVFILSMNSDNIQEDSISPRQLDLNSVTDERLRNLILLMRSFKNS